jgi:hypothetical protein
LRGGRFGRKKQDFVIIASLTILTVDKFSEQLQATLFGVSSLEYDAV